MPSTVPKVRTMKQNFYLPVFIILSFCISYLIPLTVNCQKSLPGGVQGLTYWFAVSQQEGGAVYWEDKLGNSPKHLTLSKDDYAYLNGYPVLNLAEETAPISLNIPAKTWSKSTIVSLFQVRDTSQERIIWRMATQDEIGVVLTTQRLGDVTKGRYFSDPTQLALHPVLHTYVQYQDPSKSFSKVNWEIGQLGLQAGLPLVQFVGNLPALLLYDRVLSQEEQLRVNSQLALQYGISLPRTDYLNATGEVIWDYQKNQAFPYNITGVGHDPISGFYQKRSRSQMEPKPLLELAVGAWTKTNAENSEMIPSGRFLIWSDNGERLRFTEPSSKDTKPRLLERKWMMDVEQDVADIKTTIRLHSRGLENFVREGQKIWLAIDESATGDFPFDQTRYIPVNGTEEGILQAEDVEWDIDHSGADIFSFAIGEPFIALLEATEPQCAPAQKGAMKLRILGGKAPYSIAWADSDGKQRQHWISDGKQDLSWSELNAGSYQLHISDATGASFSRMLILDNRDAPPITLENQYILEHNVPLILHAVDPTGIAADVQWTLPDGGKHFNPILEISVAGNYLLEVTRNGCARQQWINILPPSKQLVEEWQLFPNPVSMQEDFELRLSLDQERALEVLLMDINGKLISRRFLPKAAFHTYRDRVTSSGVYQLLIRADAGRFSLPIIVQ